MHRVYVPGIPRAQPELDDREVARHCPGSVQTESAQQAPRPLAGEASSHQLVTVVDALQQQVYRDAQLHCTLYAQVVRREKHREVFCVLFRSEEVRNRHDERADVDFIGVDVVLADQDESHIDGRLLACKLGQSLLKRRGRRRLRVVLLSDAPLAVKPDHAHLRDRQRHAEDSEHGVSHERCVRLRALLLQGRVHAFDDSSGKGAAVPISVFVLHLALQGGELRVQGGRAEHPCGVLTLFKSGCLRIIDNPRAVAVAALCRGVAQDEQVILHLGAVSACFHQHSRDGRLPVVHRRPERRLVHHVHASPGVQEKLQRRTVPNRRRTLKREAVQRVGVCVRGQQQAHGVGIAPPRSFRKRYIDRALQIVVHVAAVHDVTANAINAGS
eukprot:6212798-Pleurochrysis_carterae.AAC.1